MSCNQLSKLSFSALSTASGLDSNTALKVVSRGVTTSETQSEISSADSDWSDIRAIALKLGVNNPDDLHTERFKVDRQKLEQMIQTESLVEGKNGAECFFEHIMIDYNTHISWPCRLKIGAKSKKDPHVRIVGRSEDVLRAKASVLESLDSRVSRVIMKMDVSYTDHSFIIGRGGNNIKRIMEETKTHIHFPDSNRSNPVEKSNQVSLCGTLEGIEKARALVRLSSPLLISFELPILGLGYQQPDHETPYVKMIEEKYNVQIIFSSRPKLHSSLVHVKGAEKGARQLQEATLLLINFTCENVASEVLVNMQIEISPQHHEVVKGKNNAYLLDIMERTKTKIIFPDLTDMNIKPLKKSQITITGKIEYVYKARQQLIGNLPVMLIFDFPNNQNNTSDITNLSIKYGVFILLRQKQRQSTLAVVIKGMEKFIDKIYEAREEIFKRSNTLVKPILPQTYFSPQDNDFNLEVRTKLVSLLAGHPDSPKICKNIYLPNVNFFNNNNYNNKINLTDNHLIHQQQKQQQITNNEKTFTTNDSTTMCSPTHKYIHLHDNNFIRQQQNINNNNFIQSFTPKRTSSSALQQHTHPQRHLSQHTVSPRNSCHNTSGYQSFSSSTTSLEQACAPYANGGSHQHTLGLNMPITDSGLGNACMQTKPMYFSPESSSNSDLTACRFGRRSSDGVLLGLGSGSGLPSIALIPGSAESYRNLSFDMKQNIAYDYDVKRVLGFKAMERAPTSGEMRTPSAHWIGMGLSHTSPAQLTGEDATTCQNHSNMVNTDAALSSTIPSNCALSATTGVIDSTPKNRRLQLSLHKDIHSLLTSLGLEHYIKIFVLNEIDLEIFSTLTEENLMELGITAFGARRKLMVAIHSIQTSDNAAVMAKISDTSASPFSPRFSGSAAPGAERRPSNKW